MKKLNLLIIILISCYAIKAQNNYYKLIDTNKVWNNIGTNPPGEYTMFYKFSSNTSVINGNTYYFLKNSTDSTNWHNAALMREDTLNKKVYVYGNYGGEGLIYDFGSNVGDTVALFNTILCLDTCKIVITNIDSVLVGNQYRKKFIFDILPNQTCFQFSNYFIEGIGYEYGVFDIGESIIGGFYPRLVCYYENDSLMYVNPYYGQCFTTILSVEENKEQAKFEIESKGNNTFTVSAKEPIKEIVIFNIVGQKVFDKNCNTLGTSFNLADYPQGVYLIRILTVNNKEKINKIIKL